MNEMQEAAGRLPASYGPAAWRNVTPADVGAGLIGVGFDLPGGQVLRLALPLDGARHLAEALLDYLPVIHSDKSSGSPSREESIPPDSEKV